MSQHAPPWRVVVLEINEISWELMRPWLEEGRLPSFQRLREKGAWTTTHTDERGAELLEPWVTWTTFYTGVPCTEHGLKFLEQPPDTLHAKRVWEIAAAAGKKVGVFGSSNSWPPPAVDGFVVPGSFSPDSQTYPENLRPIQDLNLGHTRAHAPGAKRPGVLSIGLNALRLIRCGLNVSTVLSVLRCLFEIKRHPDRDWQKVSLQPIVNLSFFSKLYRRARPDFATFHTNHVAHYQHRFFRAWHPELFPDATDQAEVQRFGGAVRYGYEVADRLVAWFMKLADREPDLILCVASSMGQKPYTPDRYGKVAPPTCRIRSIERLVALLGLEGRCEYFSTMAPQWNLTVPDEELRRQVVHHLLSARYQPQSKGMYSVIEQRDAIVLTPISHHGLGETTVCNFPTLPGAPSLPFNELVIQGDETRKSGCHDPVGMLAFYGSAVRPGPFPDINTLDVAPTLLTLMGVPVLPAMKGQAITETILRTQASPASAPAPAREPAVLT
jgi:hypothetical protein